MQLSSACCDCMVRNAAIIARLMQMDDAQARVLVDYTRHTLADPHCTTPQHVIRKVYERLQAIMRQLPGHPDPYAELKQHSNELARAFLPQARALVARAPDPLLTATLIAAAGNIIDFGARHFDEVDVQAELAAIASLSFAHCDFAAFRQELDGAESLLYLADNAGEIVLDTLLLQQLRIEYPQLAVTVAVRERPILNDATREDAEYAGIEDHAELISSGSIYPGTILEEATPAFNRLFVRADMVISKGQGNYETLYDAPRGAIFFLLRAKCELVAHHLDAAVGDLVLWAKRA